MLRKTTVLTGTTTTRSPSKRRGLTPPSSDESRSKSPKKFHPVTGDHTYESQSDQIAASQENPSARYSSPPWDSVNAYGSPSVPSVHTTGFRHPQPKLQSSFSRPSDLCTPPSPTPQMHGPSGTQQHYESYSSQFSRDRLEADIGAEIGSANDSVNQHGSEAVLFLYEMNQYAVNPINPNAYPSPSQPEPIAKGNHRNTEIGLAWEQLAPILNSERGHGYTPSTSALQKSSTPRTQPTSPSDELAPAPAQGKHVIKEILDDVEPELVEEQQKLADLMLSERKLNVFFTGSAGSGKSTVIRYMVKRRREQGKQVHIIAPTGRAALEVNGQTIYSYAGWDLDTNKDPTALKKRVYNLQTMERIQSTDVLVLDEASMVGMADFYRLDLIMREARSIDGKPHPKPFGGVQLIVTGDFCQLPPVEPFKHCMECGSETEKTHGDEGLTYICKGDPQHGPFLDKNKWVFRGSLWGECNFIHVNLTHIHRQSDLDFKQILEKLRMGQTLDVKDRDKLLAEKPAGFNEKATKLYPRHEKVNNENLREFLKLPGPELRFKCLDSFRWENTRIPSSLETLLEGDTVVDSTPTVTSKTTDHTGMGASSAVANMSGSPSGDAQQNDATENEFIPVHMRLEKLRQEAILKDQEEQENIQKDQGEHCLAQMIRRVAPPKDSKKGKGKTESENREEDLDRPLHGNKKHRYGEQIGLKKGMRVLLQQNLDIKGGLVNGSQGKIVGFEPFDPRNLPVPFDCKRQLVRRGIVSEDAPILGGDHARWRQSEIRRFINRAEKQEWPIVQFDNVKDPVTIYADCAIRTYEIRTKAGKEKMPLYISRTQIPLMAGWAITIHKSQGMTLDSASMDLSLTFASGQIYVALSRVRSLAGLELKALRWDTGEMDEQVAEFMREKLKIDIKPAQPLSP